MAVTKKKIGISIDCDIYEAAKQKYPKISTRINELLAMDLYGSDEKDKLVQELHELKLREKVITKRICEIEKQEVAVERDISNKDAVLAWVSDVYPRVGYIGLNQLEAECKRCHCEHAFEEIKLYLESEGIATVNFA